MGSLLKEQYKFLRDMAKQIKTGQQKLDGTLLSRVELYAQAARGTHEKVRERAARIGGQMKESRRVLGASDHCQGCLRETKKGWGPIGHNAPIGSVECKSNCRCTLEFR